MRKSILLVLFVTSIFFCSKGQNQNIALNYSFGYAPDIDKFAYEGALLGNYSIGWYSYESSGEARLSGFGGIKFFTNSTPRLTISAIGNIGIGTLNPTNKLEVNGTIKTKEVNVTTSGWPDYVFKDEYNLLQLAEVEKYIQENGHLPNIPTEKHVLENGVNLLEMNVKLLEKVEELTLHMIELKKEMEALKAAQNR